jgi:hypothetical protein
LKDDIKYGKMKKKREGRKMAYERFLDKSTKPEPEVVISALGDKQELWRDIINFIAKNSDYSPEFIFFTKNYGWAERY